MKAELQQPTHTHTHTSVAAPTEAAAAARLHLQSAVSVCSFEKWISVCSFDLLQNVAFKVEENSWWCREFAYRPGCLIENQEKLRKQRFQVLLMRYAENQQRASSHTLIQTRHQASRWFDVSEGHSLVNSSVLIYLSSVFNVDAIIYC